MPHRLRRWIVQHNVDHFRELLRDETDPAHRETLERLIREEEATLSQPLEDYWPGPRSS
ncbi:MAG TPA: hypothetical protein VMI30_09765 [Stellaceae bacterium]|nr:hypothetical protein [Stellaceae bacterium]